jgi:hypothetical protein
MGSGTAGVIASPAIAAIPFIGTPVAIGVGTASGLHAYSGYEQAFGGYRSQIGQNTLASLGSPVPSNLETRSRELGFELGFIGGARVVSAGVSTAWKPARRALDELVEKRLGVKLSWHDIMSGKAEAELMKMQAKEEWRYKERAFEINELQKKLLRGGEIGDDEVSRLVGRPYFRDPALHPQPKPNNIIGTPANDNKRIRLVESTEKTVVELDKFNKAPYDPRAIENLVKKNYAGEKITSSTLPEVTAPNVNLAGKRHPVSGIVYDQRGLPIFDKHVVYETRLSNEVYKVKLSENHKRAATRDLREQIKSGKVNQNMFTKQQLKDIKAGKAQIEGLTWHHYQDTGRMQLISRDIHDLTGHIGGMKLWYEE